MCRNSWGVSIKYRGRESFNCVRHWWDDWRHPGRVHLGQDEFPGHCCGVLHIHGIARPPVLPCVWERILLAQWPPIVHRGRVREWALCSYNDSGRGRSWHARVIERELQGIGHGHGHHRWDGVHRRGRRALVDRIPLGIVRMEFRVYHAHDIGRALGVALNRPSHRRVQRVGQKCKG